MQMEKLCIILRYAAKMLWLPTDGKVNQNCVNRLCISKLPYTSYIPESAFLLLLLTSLVGTPFFEAIRSESSSFYPHWPIPSTQALHYRGLFTLLWSPFVPTLVLSQVDPNAILLTHPCLSPGHPIHSKHNLILLIFQNHQFHTACFKGCIPLMYMLLRTYPN